MSCNCLSRWSDQLPVQEFCNELEVLATRLARVESMKQFIAQSEEQGEVKFPEPLCTEAGGTHRQFALLAGCA